MLEHPFFQSPAFGGSLLLLFVITALITKRFAFRYLRRLADKTQVQWDDLLIGALGFPTTILVVALGIGILRQFPLFPETYQSPLKTIAEALLVLGLVLFVDRLLVGGFKGYVRKNPQVENYRGVVGTLIHLAVGSIGLVFFLDSIGVAVTPLIASLGVGSLAIALALQDTLVNFFSGVYLLIDRPVQVGHYIRLEGGEEGYVTNVGWRSTRIKRLQNNTVVIPNSKIASATLTNFYIPERELSVLVQVGVHYDSDLEHVERIACEVGQETMEQVPGGVKGFKPFIRYHTFADSSINFTVILRAKEYVDQYLVKHEFVKKLHKRFDQEEIEIPYPIRSVYFRSSIDLLDKEQN